MRLTALIVVLVGWPLVATAAESDSRRLAAPLPPGFRRPTVLLYPLLDQRALKAEAVDEQGAAAPEEPPAWKAFVGEVARRANLDVQSPAKTIERLRSQSDYAVKLQLAETQANEGYEDYREVRLDRAVTKLEKALQVFYAIEHQVVDPRAVARAEVTRGLAALETGDQVSADAAFRAALLVDPRVRLRAGYDRPEALAAFEKARQALVEAPAAPPDHTRAPPWLARATDTYVVRVRVVPGEGERFELTLLEPSGSFSPESQRLSDDAADDASRLASRVWACLPFGSLPGKKKHQRRLYLDAGFSYFVFGSAAFSNDPVGAFGNFGAAANLSWLVVPNLSLDAWFSLTNSNRDSAEDLRADIVTARLSAGPGITGEWGRWRGFANVGFEVASPGGVTTTTNAGCKYGFDDPPTNICDPELDIDEVDRSVLIGAAVSTGGSLRLVDDLYLALRINAAEYFFETEDTGLQLPIGAHVGLGYRFF